MILLGGCLRADLVECGDGIACGPDSKCATFVTEQRRACIPDDAFTPCEDHDPLDTCTLEGTSARCYATDEGLACLPSSCGNALIDPGEACDDGNALVGDGCSAGCTSDETCGNSVIDALVGEQCDDGNLVGHDGCASDCATESPRWTQVLPEVALSRRGHRLAYDSTRGRVITFGGGSNRIYELGEVGWEAMSTPISPLDRREAALVYDPERHRTVLFGGITSSQFGDTWLWNGSSWLLADPAMAPTPRYGAATAWDARSKRVLVYGGYSVAADDVMWAWDGVRWERIDGAGTSPGSLYAGGMAADPLRGVIVLLGAPPDAQMSPRTFEWDGQAWTSGIDSPPALAGRGIAFDGTSMIAIGSDMKTYRWDGTQWRIVGAAPDISGGMNEAIVWDAAHRRVVALADSGVTYAWERGVWTPLAIEPAPPSRTLYAAAFDSGRGRWVMFGGLELGMPRADTWELVGQRWVRRATSGPPSSIGPQMVYDVRLGESLLYVSGQLWSWDGARWLERPSTTPPPQLTFPGMAYDAKRGVAVLFGSDAGVDDGTWEWDGTSWTEHRPAVRPAGRHSASLVWDPVHERVVLGFGLDSAGQFLADVWEWDGTTWTQRAQTGPSARSEAALVWDSRRRRLVLFGGTITIPMGIQDDVWELGARWNQLFIESAAPRRSGHRMLEAPDGNGLLTFGGSSPSATNETWRLSFSNTTSTYEACTSAALDLDGDGLAGCLDPDCWKRCTPACPPGAPCDPSFPHCGDGACGAVESCRLCPADCGACTPVCGDDVCDPGETCPGDC